MMTGINADVALLTEQHYTAAVTPEENWYLDDFLGTQIEYCASVVRHPCPGFAIRARRFQFSAHEWQSRDTDESARIQLWPNQPLMPTNLFPNKQRKRTP